MHEKTANKVQLIEKADYIFYGQVNQQTLLPRGKGIQIGRSHLIQGNFGGGRVRIMWDDGDEYVGNYHNG